MVIQITPTDETTLLTSEEPTTSSMPITPALDLTSVAIPVPVVLRFAQDREDTAASARIRLIDRYSHMYPIDHSSYTHHVPSEPND